MTEAPSAVLGNCEHEQLTGLLRRWHTVAEKGQDAAELREEMSESISLLKASWNGLQEAMQNRQGIEDTIGSDLATLRAAVREMFG